jgi:hypothetical protein
VPLSDPGRSSPILPNVARSLSFGLPTAAQRLASIASEGRTLVDIPGEHLTLIGLPHVEALVRAFDRSLPSSWAAARPSIKKLKREIIGNKPLKST